MADANPNPTPADDSAAKAKAKAERVAAKKELKAMHKIDRTDPKANFDHKRFHALHYLAAGKPVPDPDDAD